MKKLLVVLAAVLVLTGCASSKEENTLTVATSPDYPPYEFPNPNAKGDDDKFFGADIELAKYIADKLGRKLVIQPVDFATIPAAIAAKKYDVGISGFTYEKERAEVIAFSKSYDTTESACQGLMVKKENLDKYKDLQDFADVKIGVQNASAQLGYVNEQLSTAKVQLVASLSDATLQLDSNKIDALAISCASGETVMTSNKNLVLTDIKFKINPDEGTMVIAAKDNQDLLDEINKIIDEVTEKGLYTQWYEAAIKQAEDLGVE